MMSAMYFEMVQKNTQTAKEKGPPDFVRRPEGKAY